MAHPLPVDVDLILDPFVGNVLPRSLVPTVGYVVVVAGVAYFVARVVVRFLNQVVGGGDGVRDGVKKMQ